MEPSFSSTAVSPQCDSWTPAFYNDVLYSYVQGSFVASEPASGALLWNKTMTAATSRCRTR